MIYCRILLLLCVVAIVALTSLPTTQVSAFSTSPPPSRGSTLKGSSSSSNLSLLSPSRHASNSRTALYAVKKSKKKSDGEEVVNFKKADFVSAVAEKTGMTKAESDLALAAVLNVIATEVADGKRISLPGFGTFKLNFRAARKGRNPATGAEIDIKASYSPSFTASKSFKEMCNPDR